ncbi:protein YgfX [Paraburkholderia sp. BL10I2N1]|uniref:protein YgfX n=1 Tax=Paraburkholderia sp. BL10I2N1 TaxID=1938796 RepID=UPI003260E1D7
MAAYSCLASRLGGWHALPLALAVLALLVSGATAHASAQPRALRIGPDGLSVWSRGGEALAHGPIVGYSQWGGWLLILAVANDSGRLRRLIISADALPDDAFRKLAVLGRRGSSVL